MAPEERAAAAARRAELEAARLAAMPEPQRAAARAANTRRHAEQRRGAPAEWQQQIATERRRQRQENLQHLNCARSGNFQETDVLRPPIDVDPTTGRHYLGQHDAVCPHCDALHWLGERTGGRADQPEFSMCCSKGKVHLPPLQDTPEPLRSLLDGSHPLSRHFLEHVRQYNNIFQLSSCGACLLCRAPAGVATVLTAFVYAVMRFDDTFERLPGVHTVRIQGSVYHLMGDLLPRYGDPPKFAQIYFYDEASELQNRMGIFPHTGLRPELVRQLQDMLHERNAYVRQFRTAIARDAPPDRNWRILLRSHRGACNAADLRRL
jgi:hypothetical protein